MMLYNDIDVDVNNAKVQALISFFSAIEKKTGLALNVIFSKFSHRFFVFAINEAGVRTSMIAWRYIFSLSNVYNNIAYIFKMDDNSIVLRCPDGHLVKVYVADTSSPEAMKMSCDFGMLDVKHLD